MVGLQQLHDEFNSISATMDTVTALPQASECMNKQQCNSN